MTIRCIPYFTLEPQDYPPRLEHRIVKAAVRLHDNVYTAWRHSDIWSYLIHHNRLPEGFSEKEGDAGFVDEGGFFFTRYQACKVAMGARQLRGDVHDLMSEEVWDKDGNPRTPGVPYHPCS